MDPAQIGRDAETVYRNKEGTVASRTHTRTHTHAVPVRTSTRPLIRPTRTLRFPAPALLRRAR